MTTWEHLQKWRNISLAIFILMGFTRKIPFIPSFVHDFLLIISLITVLIRVIVLLKQESKHPILNWLFAIIFLSLIGIIAIKML